MSSRLQEIVRSGEEHIRMSRDDKMFVYEGDMRLLLCAPSTVMHLNDRQVGNGYVTEVKFCGIIFVTVTDNPIDFGKLVA